MQLKIVSFVTCFLWNLYCSTEVKTEIEVVTNDPDSSLILLINEQEQNFNNDNQSY